MPWKHQHTSHIASHSLVIYFINFVTYKKFSSNAVLKCECPECIQSTNIPFHPINWFLHFLVLSRTYKTFSSNLDLKCECPECYQNTNTLLPPINWFLHFLNFITFLTYSPNVSVLDCPKMECPQTKCDPNLDPIQWFLNF
jgi:hypothetical protein